jgi:hypothetical protein
MHSPNQKLDGAKHRSSPNSQSILEHPVVKILDPDAGEAMENVDRFQYLSQVYHPYLPSALLLVGKRLQRDRGSPMTSAGIEKD